MTLEVKAIIDAILESAILGQPRSRQQAIGPSEIGAACTHCLCAKLAGWEQMPEAAWLPFLGTAFHAYVEPIFGAEADWLTEKRVSVGKIGPGPIDGTSDAFHIPTGTVVDWKLVGRSTLRSAKAGPSPVYRRQAHCYGLGYLRAGFDVRNVAIYYLPRNELRMSAGVYWFEPFDAMIALEALDRATELLAKLEGFPTTEARDAWITTQERDANCYDCGKYPDRPVAAPKDSLSALLGV